MMKLNPAATITEEFAERIKSENRSAKMMKLAPLIVLACLVVVFLIVCGASFLSPKNIMNILNQMALPLVVALGLTFVIREFTEEALSSGGLYEIPLVPPVPKRQIGMVRLKEVAMPHALQGFVELMGLDKNDIDK